MTLDSFCFLPVFRCEDDNVNNCFTLSCRDNGNVPCWDSRKCELYKEQSVQMTTIYSDTGLIVTANSAV